MGPEHRWRVAVLDSGWDPSSGLPVLAFARFDAPAGTCSGAELSDPLGHGTRVARIIASTSPPPGLLIARVLDAQGLASAAALAAALDWAIAQGAQLVHMSLGLSQDRAVLRDAVAAAVRAGALLVASCPARGAPSYPAGYAGVLRASGDARCSTEDLSFLGDSEDKTGAEFGGCVRLPGEDRARGASIGAAHVTRLIITQTPPGTRLDQVRTQLIARAAFQGRERRG